MNLTLISWISYRVGEEGKWDTSKGIMTPTNATSYQVIGLFPYTVYSFRVLAVNSMGESKPSVESYYIITLREGIISDIEMS